MKTEFWNVIKVLVEKFTYFQSVSAKFMYYLRSFDGSCCFSLLILTKFARFFVIFRWNPCSSSFFDKVYFVFAKFIFCSIFDLLVNMAHYFEILDELHVLFVIFRPRFWFILNEISGWKMLNMENLFPSWIYQIVINFIFEINTFWRRFCAN